MDFVNTADNQVRLLHQQIEAGEEQLRALKVQLQQAEQQAEAARHLNDAYQGGFPAEWAEEALMALQEDVTNDIAQKIRQHGTLAGGPTMKAAAQPRRWPLDAHEYKRYGRQLIMPEVGLHGQLRLKNSKVLIVGVGGLGCPAAAYLAGAGVGRLGLVDGDTVEESNLHRQVAHSTARVGMNKAESAIEYLQSLNPNVAYIPHPHHLDPQNAPALFVQYDLILDCTDNPNSRYLISDTCVRTGKPLISASALKTEGQIILLNHDGGPCYRCIFPRPPPPETVGSCGESGILGPVVGVMGVLQALEAIKLIAASSPLESTPSLLMFSAYSTPQFRSVRMRGRRKDCVACSSPSSIPELPPLVCGPTDVLGPESRISATDFARLPRDGSNVLIDVRDPTQYAICALRGSVNVPWTGDGEGWVQQMAASQGEGNYYVVCRYGNDSQQAVRAAMEQGLNLKDVKGGFRAWREEVDGSWPDY